MKPLYEQEIDKISNIESEYDKLSDEQLKYFLYETYGIVLLSIQKTEFIIQGIVSHFNQDLLDKNKNFKNLTPRVFLDNDEDSKKKRKQTLGIILRFLTDSTDLFEYEELNEYTGLSYKNLFRPNLDIWHHPRDKKTAILVLTQVKSTTKVTKSDTFFMNFCHIRYNYSVTYFL